MYVIKVLIVQVMREISIVCSVPGAKHWTRQPPASLPSFLAQKDPCRPFDFENLLKIYPSPPGMSRYFLEMDIADLKDRIYMNRPGSSFPKSFFRQRSKIVTDQLV